ncbi:hypothetical protein Clacol_003659 [Clathrus columnatus]|uniref:Cas1p 10 TM acyl transferase domain-containing protein n=1 Tax=Clathrus columnatus TaxID=1419009 RepID=A0AAV5A4C2_9AGAM|nr:hypothetical protein Clacol_003659 [Clathrus columnatus]
MSSRGRFKFSSSVSWPHWVAIGTGIASLVAVFFRYIFIADPTLPSEPPDNNQKHIDYDFTSKASTEFSFIWDPFFNSTRTHEILTSYNNSPGIFTSSSIRTPAMVVLGTGLWFLRYPASGGLPQWEQVMKSTMTSIFKSQPEMADMLVFLPVEKVVPEKLLPERRMSMTNPDIEAMNADMESRIHSFLDSQVSGYREEPYPTVAFSAVFNKMLDASETTDGLHYSSSITAMQSNILLNLRCNDVLPKKFPLDKTCCRSYPQPSIYQLVVLFGLTLWGPAFSSSGYTRAHHMLPSKENITALSTFGLSILLIYLSDRTHVFLKEQKQYNRWEFGVWSLLILALGLYTLQRSDKDLGFLSRQQTDEWKGWMQIVILIYHYLGASKISGIYNPIRVLVAAYLFMTGYGHTSYYMKKADFSIQRVSQVLVRLNLLPIILAYTMDTDYLNYYFSPLVSMWFIVIYLTMAVGKKYNERTLILLFKIFISMGVVTFLMREKWPLRFLFIILENIFRIRWSAQEWDFRVTLDLWIVYGGMLAAIAYIKIRERRLTDHPRWPTIQRICVILSILITVWFFIFEISQPSKFAYNKWHPFISILPIGAFVALRNANALETFIVQYHLWLAADTKGILRVIPGTTWRLPNLLISSIIFIWISHILADATNHLTAWICNNDEQSSLPVRNTTSSEEFIPLRESNDHPPDGDQADWVRQVTERNRLYIGYKVLFLNKWSNGTIFRCLLALAVMWLLNLLWPNS